MKNKELEQQAGESMSLLHEHGWMKTWKVIQDLIKEIESLEKAQPPVEHWEYTCPDCGGDGMDTCNNPDHGFIEEVGGEVGRLGCAGCGHNPDHKTGRQCEHCNGTGTMNQEQFQKYIDETKYVGEINAVCYYE